MIVNQSQDFLNQLDQGDYPAGSPVCADAVLMVEPSGFSVSPESAADNCYMDLTGAIDSARAMRQSKALAQALECQGIEVISFPGRVDTPDAVFPNNVFATIPGRLIIGHMLHPVRQREAKRADIRQYFSSRGYQTVDLSHLDCIAELTGPLVIDHARRIGFCGMTGRVDQAGLAAMHDAFDLEMIFSFELHAEEYHTNVVMMVLAGRACVIFPGAFVDPLVPAAIERAFPGRTLILNEQEKNAFAGNCIALSERDLFMSLTGVNNLRGSSLARLRSWGFQVHSVALDEIEKAGGSLRCMVAEVFGCPLSIQA